MGFSFVNQLRDVAHGGPPSPLVLQTGRSIAGGPFGIHTLKARRRRLRLEYFARGVRSTSGVVPSFIKRRRGWRRAGGLVPSLGGYLVNIANISHHRDIRCRHLFCNFPAGGWDDATTATPAKASSSFADRARAVGRHDAMAATMGKGSSSRTQ